MWEAQASKPGSPDRTTDHTPMRTKPRLIPATCTNQPESTMLQIILIGAALSHVRPEPPTSAGLPTDPQRFIREHWRTINGVAAFWR